MNEEDLKEIVFETSTQEEFIEVKNKEDFQKVASELAKRFNISEPSIEDIKKIYLELKNRCLASDVKIGKFLNMHESKLRRLLKKKR